MLTFALFVLVFAIVFALLVSYGRRLDTPSTVLSVSRPIYRPYGGKGENARRVRQIESGYLTSHNGLVR